MSTIFLTTKGQSKLLALSDPNSCGTVEPYTFKIGIGIGLSPLSTDLVSPVAGPYPVRTVKTQGQEAPIRVIICDIPQDIGNYDITELGIWDKQGDMIIGAVFDPPIPIRVDPTVFSQKAIAIPFYAIGILSNLTLSVSSKTIRYTHVQNTPTTTWTIEHKLNRIDMPVVQVTDFSGRILQPTEIRHSADITRLTFDNPVSGIAILVF